MSQINIKNLLWQNNIRDMTEKKAHIIVVSNEKGGTGKSTISMHLAVKLLYEGFSVATIDLDGRQGSLSKYIENRRRFCENNKYSLPCPDHHKMSVNENFSAIAEEKRKLNTLISSLSAQFDAVIIDTPGTKNYLFEEAHKYADTLITPVSDSLIDLSVLADIDFYKDKIEAPGPYANFIWDVKKSLAAQGRTYLNWIVVGNKLSNYNSKNKNIVFSHLEKMSKLYGFRFLHGLKDRVIYKELFLEGLTVLDMNQDCLKLKLSVSHIAAKREIRNLAEFICPEK